MDPRRETRIKWVGGELLYRERGGDWAAMQEAIEDAERRAVDLRPAWNDFQGVWWSQNEDMFDSQGVPPWADLSPRYAAWKEEAFPDAGILERTRRLRDSLTGPGPDSVYIMTPRTLKMGTRVPYSDVLQEGTDNMPAREHNILFDESFMILVEMVGEYVTEPLDKAFGPAAS